MRIGLTGDVMLGRGMANHLGKKPPEGIWGDVIEDLRAHDLLFMNLECVISDCGAPVDKTFTFRAPPAAVDALAAAGVDAVSIANNHVLDYGENALLDMIRRLDERGIRHVGAGKDFASAWKRASFHANGLRVALVAFTDNEPDWAAAPSSAGVAHAAIVPGSRTDHMVRARVRAAAALHDVVVLSAHWGPNMRQEPPRAFRTFAHSMIDAGATIFWGHSAHIVQGIERRGSGIILYDTGDFVDDYVVDPHLRNDRSFLFSLDVGPEGVTGIDLTPVTIHAADGRVDRASDDEATWLFTRLRELSLKRDLDTGLTGHVSLPPATRP